MLDGLFLQHCVFSRLCDDGTRFPPLERDVMLLRYLNLGTSHNRLPLLPGSLPSRSLNVADHNERALFRVVAQPPAPF
jgi:hypothetical protein